MSEWIDFAVYALQVVMLGVFIPRQSLQFTGPAIVDRDPAWPAAHPAVMDAIARSRWFLNSFYVWTALSIGALLALRLGWMPAAASLETPSWESLQRLHALCMTVGVIGYLACFLYWTYWLAASVPLAARRQATLKPRVAGDYVPRWWRVSTQVMTAAHLALWLILPAFGVGGDGHYWRTFAFVAAITAVLAGFAYWTPRRRPNYGDRLFGDAYRRAELRGYYLTWLAAPLAISVRAYGEAITGFDLDRVSYLALMLFCSAFALAFLRLRPTGSGGAATGYAPFTPERRSAA